MPDSQEHLEKYRHNRTFLDGPPAVTALSNPWATIVAFHAAVHLVKYLAANEQIHHRRHLRPASRERYLSHHPAHQIIEADITALLIASMYARYDSVAAFSQSCPGDSVQIDLIDKCLAAIESHVRIHHPGSL